jgi:hypothetical protein
MKRLFLLVLALIAGIAVVMALTTPARVSNER